MTQLCLDLWPPAVTSEMWREANRIILGWGPEAMLAPAFGHVACRGVCRTGYACQREVMLGGETCYQHLPDEWHLIENRAAIYKLCHQVEGGIDPRVAGLAHRSWRGVYFIEGPTHVKIGKANTWERVRTVIASNTENVWLRRFVTHSDPLALESELHRMFKAARTWGRKREAFDKAVVLPAIQEMTDDAIRALAWYVPPAPVTARAPLDILARWVGGWKPPRRAAWRALTAAGRVRFEGHDP